MRSIIKGRHYRLILLGMISVVFCYTSVPALYQFLMPVRALDIPFLNFTGMAMIAVSLVWTSVMQLEFDQILFKQTDERSDVLPAVIGDYAKEIQLGYFLIMLGIALVLINAVSIALMAIACIISYNSRRVAV
ncbi:MAG: hypothetical protein EOP56_14310 [Sphingobacteriales bacterium]|nr:MAG: hypothetical protein EOP56_14310 [Sphingobacteriales bacterium]